MTIKIVSCPRLSSITTRIKTDTLVDERPALQRPRLSSITTRIKTNNSFSGQRTNTVRDYLPLQQGLRLSKGIEEGKSGRPRLSSITTRIKTEIFKFFHLLCKNVRDYLPLQQGLRLRCASCSLASSHRSETIFHYNKD